MTTTGCDDSATERNLPITAACREFHSYQDLSCHMFSHCLHFIAVLFTGATNVFAVESRFYVMRLLRRGFGDDEG